MNSIKINSSLLLHDRKLFFINKLRQFLIPFHCLTLLSPFIFPSVYLSNNEISAQQKLLNEASQIYYAIINYISCLIILQPRHQLIVLVPMLDRPGSLSGLF